MITFDQYNNIAQKYGHVASWAVWESAGDTPKSNIGGMGIFDIEKSPQTLELLDQNIVMVGLNFSRDVKFEKPFMNFHDSNPHGNDFKIRYAFEDTPFYGAYMTDIIKGLSLVSSKDVLNELKKNPDTIKKQIESFRAELKFIGSQAPTILAFGKDVFRILKDNLDAGDYSRLVQLTHYSHQISKENYRKDTHSRLYESLGVVASSVDFIKETELEINKCLAAFNKLDCNTDSEVSAMSELRKATKLLLARIDGRKCA